LGKNSCGVFGLDAAGRIVLRHRMRRETIVALAVKLPQLRHGNGGLLRPGRLLVAQGHEVRLMSPEYVCPYVKVQKNDNGDAEAIAEAATCPTMRFVPLASKLARIAWAFRPAIAHPRRPSWHWCLLHHGISFSIPLSSCQ
jgi:hypothetical protein